MCNQSFIPLERWCLFSVRPAPHPSWEMTVTQRALGPSSLRHEVYIVCSEPIIPKRWRLPLCSKPLNFSRDEVYPLCSQLLIHERWSLPSVQPVPRPSWRWCLFSVQLAPHPSWVMTFTQCALGPSSLIHEVYIVWPSVQRANHP